eukprot:10602247-Alexandrium_andersonii.AAC.1
MLALARGCCAWMVAAVGCLVVYRLDWSSACLPLCLPACLQIGSLLAWSRYYSLFFAAPLVRALRRIVRLLCWSTGSPTYVCYELAAAKCGSG